MILRNAILFLFIIFYVAFFISCSVTLPPVFVINKSPHQNYEQRLLSSKLDETVMGNRWINAADESLSKPIPITLPYAEAGYFGADEVRAEAFYFIAKQGERITVRLSLFSQNSFHVYTDLFQSGSGTAKSYKLLASMATGDSIFNFDADKTDTFILRIQPELLSKGEYRLTVSAGPSLGFPVQGKSSIGSYYGDPRDRGVRTHEGIDIFAARNTPAIAAANGMIVQVNENSLGGKTVWLRPSGKNYTLYYAHLDSQISSVGQSVKEGDTIGLVGNTGNAKSTSPHLHFGIYAMNGTVDPLPYVKPPTKEIPAVNFSSPQHLLRSTLTGKQKLYAAASVNAAVLETLPQNTLLKAEATTSQYYRVVLPDETTGYVQRKSVTDATVPLRKIAVLQQQLLLDHPDTMAATKKVLNGNSSVQLLGSFNEYLFVQTADSVNGWILSK